MNQSCMILHMFSSLFDGHIVGVGVCRAAEVWDTNKHADSTKRKYRAMGA